MQQVNILPRQTFVLSIPSLRTKQGSGVIPSWTPSHMRQFNAIITRSFTSAVTNINSKQPIHISQLLSRRTPRLSVCPKPASPSVFLAYCPIHSAIGCAATCVGPSSGVVTCASIATTTGAAVTLLTISALAAGPNPRFRTPYARIADSAARLVAK